MAPSPEAQMQFLVNLQRLLEEGLFVASYKFSLLLALADLSVESGDDSGAPLSLTTQAIAIKFIEYYWRQAIPYPSTGEARILKQNTGRQAEIVNNLRNAREKYGASVSQLMNQPTAWNGLVRNVARVVCVMPLWKLQTVGQERLDFLYENRDHGSTIELRPSVAFCFRKFHALISDLVRGAWIRYVRQQNLDILGEATDLYEFLFGSERTVPSMARPILMEVQHGQCFYCGSSLNAETTHVDHFVPWARYPVDLGHNFVLADSRCNGKKRDRLPAYRHLVTWTERNLVHGEQITDALKQSGISTELATSKQITYWAYGQTEAAAGLTWVKGDELVPLATHWRDLFS